MRDKQQRWKVLVILGLTLFIPNMIPAKERNFENPSANKADTTFSLPGGNDAINVASSIQAQSLSLERRYMHKIGIEARPGRIIRVSPFLQGENENMRPIKNALSTHLKYSFQAQPDSYTDRIFGGVYQGIGLAYYTFGEKNQLGDPFAFYLFQGAHLAMLCDRLSLNYEWNFGLSTGWKPYNPYDNYYNVIIGSKTNAYINTNVYLNLMLSRKFDLTTGITLTHFSNGNTRFPNAGLNTVDLKAGLTYNFNRKKRFLSESSLRPPVPEFPRHISYDFVLFGSWRRKGIALGEEHIALPNTYPVFGINFAPMYNINYRFRAGVSLDGYYNGSANIYVGDYIIGTEPVFIKPPLSQQLALGLSGRTEYVMPYFSVNLGMGVNILHNGGDMKAFYQILALKIEVTHNSFIHIGYSLHNFDTPNSLMLGIGYRFNNKYPKFFR
jgi:hypothetical protein